MKVLLFNYTFAYWMTFLLSSLPNLLLACKCIPPVLKEDLYDNPDSTVIAGRILRELATMDGYFDRHFVFEVKQVYKACSIKEQDTIIVSTSASSASCGLDLKSNTQYIFAAHMAEDNELPTAVRVSVGLCDYNAEWPLGVSDEDKRTLRLYKTKGPASNANCSTSSSPCQTGADCDEMTEYCDASKTQCISIDAPCPTALANCFAAPCTVTDPCQEADGPLICLDNYCGGCNAIFLDADRTRVCN
jgi:hypothetical protein